MTGIKTVLKTYPRRGTKNGAKTTSWCDIQVHIRAELSQNSNDFPLSRFSLIRKTRGEEPLRNVQLMPATSSQMQLGVHEEEDEEPGQQACLDFMCRDVRDENNVLMSLKLRAQRRRVAANSPRRALSRRRKCCTVSLPQMAEKEER